MSKLKVCEKSTFIYFSLSLSGLIYLFLLLNWEYISQSDFFPVRDNMVFHFFNYTYIANSIAHGFGLPSWYPIAGGSPIGATSLAWASAVPHRLFGYLLYAWGPFDLVTSYKLTTFIGIFLIAGGWWLFCYELFNNRVVASFCALFFMFTGQSVTVLHHEHVIGTMFWVPWILICLLRVQRDIRFLVPLAFTTGVAITTCFPHYIFIPLLLMISCFLVFRRKAIRLPSNLRSAWRSSVLLSGITFVAAVSPLAFVVLTRRDFAAPMRGFLKMEINSLQDYIQLNTAQASSATMEYVWQYIRLNPTTPDDMMAMHLTYTVLALALFGLIVNFRRVLPLTVLLGLLVWSTLGINHYAAQFFYIIRFPFISLFRQWYQLFPMVSFVAIIMAGFGLLWLYNKLNKLARRSVFAILFICFSIEGYRYYQVYFERHIRPMQHSFRPIPKLSADAYRELLNQDWTLWLRQYELKDYWRGWIGESLVHLTFEQRKRWTDLCPLLAAKTPYSLPRRPAYLTEAAFVAKDFANSEFCPLFLSFPLVTDKTFQSGNWKILETKDSTSNLPESVPLNLQVLPSGFEIKQIPAKKGLIVAPYARNLKPSIVDQSGNQVTGIGLFNDAFTGVDTDGTIQALHFKVPYTIYEYALALQLLLAVAVGVRTVNLVSRKGAQSDAAKI